MPASKSIQLLNDLVTWIVQPGLTVADTVAKLGALAEPQLGQVLINARDAQITYAVAAPQDEAEELAYIRLTLAELVGLAELEAAFGAYSRLPRMPNRPAQVMFRPESSGESHQAALFVDLEDQSARNFLIRRDIRLV